MTILVPDLTILVPDLTFLISDLTHLVPDSAHVVVVFNLFLQPVFLFQRWNFTSILINIKVQILHHLLKAFHFFHLLK